MNWKRFSLSKRILIVSAVNLKWHKSCLAKKKSPHLFNVIFIFFCSFPLGPFLHDFLSFPTTLPPLPSLWWRLQPFFFPLLLLLQQRGLPEQRGLSDVGHGGFAFAAKVLGEANVHGSANDLTLLRHREATQKKKKNAFLSSVEINLTSLTKQEASWISGNSWPQSVLFSFAQLSS